MISKRIERVAAIGVVCCLILSLVNVVFLASTHSMSAQGHSLRWMRRVRLPSLNNETEMQQRVKSAMQWAWSGYRSKAFGYDFLDVVNKNGSSFSELDLAISLVDSLDTLFLLGFHDEFNEAAAWAESNLAQRFDRPGYVSLFETTIRVLGGLLSAYHLSGREGLLDLADGLGQRLMPGLRSSIFPRCYVSLSDGKTSGQSLLAEFTSIQLEFKYLSVLTDDRNYFDAVEDIMETVRQIVEREYVDGLVPLGVDHDLGRIHRSRIKLGAGGDSYYEYLLKQWLLSGKRETAYRDMYATAINGIMEKMVGRTKKSGLLFLGELEVNGELTPKMDHLVCFIPGMLALGYMNGMPESHLDLAKDLVHTCFEMYNQMPSKLSPEIVLFNTFDNSNDIEVHPGDAFNILRPETVESLMMLYRVTKNETYREWGKVIFEAFERHCRLPQGGGYSSIGHVNDETPTKFFRREMDSFFMAETLKYLYLLFSDEHVVPLDKFVLTTEAHPIPIQFEKWISK